MRVDRPAQTDPQRARRIVKISIGVGVALLLGAWLHLALQMPVAVFVVFLCLVAVLAGTEIAVIRLLQRRSGGALRWWRLAFYVATGVLVYVFARFVFPGPG